MSDEQQRRDELEQRDADDGPRQTVRRMAEDTEPDVGPYYPSGMSAPEAAAAGATADLSDQELERLNKRSGRDLEDPDEDDDE